MAKEESASVSNDSKAYLDEVKKGKSRKFAMICKGTEVISLVVYKKGGVEKRKKEAKEAGKGQFYFGTVGGKGIDINFILARSDGFESAPVKNTVLKNFLSEAADFNCKPIFEIVDSPQVVLDEEDPLVARFLKSQELAQATCDRFPDRASEINALCLDTGRFLDQDQPEQAIVKLALLESLLEELKGTGSPQTTSTEKTSTETTSTATQPAASTTQASPTTASPENVAIKMAETLKKLKPTMDSVINSEPNRKGELQAKMGAIVGEIKSKEFDRASQHIAEFSAFLQSLVAQQTPSTENETDERMKEFVRRRDALEPRLLEAQKMDREKATKLGAVWDFANSQAEAMHFDTAMKGLDRLATAIDGILVASPTQGTGPTAGQGVVTAAVTRLELQQVRLSAIQGVNQLEKALRETNDAIAHHVAEIVSQLSRNLPTELEAILERFDQAVKLQDTASILALKGEIRAAAKAWLQFMEQNASHIAGCESNPWNIPVRIVQPIRNSLSAILKVAA